jgi:adenylate cyclase
MKILRERARGIEAAPVGFGILISLIIIALRQTGLLQAAELGVYDAYMRWSPATESAAPPLTIIELRESDIQNLKTWPIHDETMAILLERLLLYEPRAIGIDIYRDLEVGSGRDRLDAVLRSDKRLIAVYRFPGTRSGITSPPVLWGTPQVGFNDLMPDPGGIVRRGLLFMTDDDGTSTGGKHHGYSIALRLALRYLSAEGIWPVPDPDVPEHMRLGHHTFTPLEASDGSYSGMDARGYQFVLDFESNLDEVPRYSLVEFLFGNPRPDDFKDRIVLIGTTAESVPDHFYTPLSSGLADEQQMPGVIVHAHIVGQLIRLARGQSTGMGFGTQGVEMLWILLWGIAGALAARRVRSPWRIAVIGVAGAGLLTLITFSAFVYHWWIPVVPAALAWFGSGALHTAYLANLEARQRRALMNLFARHVDPKLAEAIWAERDKFLQGGKPSATELTATVMLTDLHEFTHIAEKLSPADVMDWLNEYLEAMTPLIMNHGGVVMRFIGDAIMAAFGVPLPRATEAEIRTDAVNAVRCALAMQKRLIELNHDLRARHLPMLGIRIGIYTGPMAGGSMGNIKRLEYNVHGDSVNTAARLESFDKEKFVPDYDSNPGRILIGDATRDHLGDEFIMTEIGRFSLRGKDRDIVVYQVLGERAEAPESADRAGPV